MYVHEHFNICQSQISNLFLCVFHLLKLCGKSVRSWCDRSSDRSFMVNPLSYFSFQPINFCLFLNR